MSFKNSKILDKTIIEENKTTIINLFNTKIKGKKSDVLSSNSKHDGKDGHWLEKTMGLKFNNKNLPDILGFEMKNATTSKTSFGDWSGDYRLFSKRAGGEITQNEFLEIFGQPNTEHDGRLAWSGTICPNKVGDYTIGGQKLAVNKGNNISATYSYSKDKRVNKQKIVPIKYQIEDLVLASWSEKLMRRRVESKFNQNGWFKCEKDKKTQIYTSIVFGAPITFETWIEFVKSGDVIFDSGMHQGNPRPYANWRASNKFWDSLVESRN